jgi:DNA-binding MarR family transcriptional regulator
MSKPINTIPNRYLAKILQLDHSTISLYKKAASGAGYITTEHQYEDLQLQIKFLYPLQKSLLEEAHLLVTHDNSVQRQFPDEITSTIRLKRKRMYPT